MEIMGNANIYKAIPFLLKNVKGDSVNMHKLLNSFISNPTYEIQN